MSSLLDASTLLDGFRAAAGTSAAAAALLNRDDSTDARKTKEMTKKVKKKSITNATAGNVHPRASGSKKVAPPRGRRRSESVPEIGAATSARVRVGKRGRKPGPRPKVCPWCVPPPGEKCTHCHCLGYEGCTHPPGTMCPRPRYKRRLVCNPCEKHKLKFSKFHRGGSGRPSQQQKPPGKTQQKQKQDHHLQQQQQEQQQQQHPEKGQEREQVQEQEQERGQRHQLLHRQHHQSGRPRALSCPQVSRSMPHFCFHVLVVVIHIVIKRDTLIHQSIPRDGTRPGRPRRSSSCAPWKNGTARARRASRRSVSQVSTFVFTFSCCTYRCT